MNLKNNIKSKQIQTVRHNPDKDSCWFDWTYLWTEMELDQKCNTAPDNFCFLPRCIMFIFASKSTN